MSTKQRLYRDNIFAILDELDFSRYIETVAPRMIINPATFEKNDQLFRHVYYFLFYRFNKEQAKGRFRSVYPTRDKKQEAEFRQITIKWLEEIGGKYSGANFDKILPIYYQRLFGKPYLELTYRLALLVFKKTIKQTDRNDENDDGQQAKLLEQIGGETESEKLKNLLQELSTFDQQLTYFEGRVQKRNELLKSQDEHLKKESARLDMYRSGEFLDKVNAKLTNELAEINDYMRDILETIQMKPKAACYRVTTPENSGSSDSLLSTSQNLGESLLEQMKQYELFLKFIKNPKNEIMKALKDAGEYTKALQTYKSIMSQAKKEAIRREEMIAHIRGEIAEMPKVKELRHQILNYYKPIFDVSLNFANYQLPKELTEYDFSQWPPLDGENDAENQEKLNLVE